MDYSTMKEVVSAGLKTGFRAFDTARDYGNEHIVGKVLKECLAEQGLKREDIFITTKIGNGQQRLGNIAEQIKRVTQESSNRLCGLLAYALALSELLY